MTFRALAAAMLLIAVPGFRGGVHAEQRKAPTLDEILERLEDLNHYDLAAFSERAGSAASRRSAVSSGRPMVCAATRSCVSVMDRMRRSISASLYIRSIFLRGGIVPRIARWAIGSEPFRN